jgi:hypothetical protein
MSIDSSAGRAMVKHSGLCGSRIGDNKASLSLSPNESAYEGNSSQVIDFYKIPAVVFFRPLFCDNFSGYER